MADARRLSHPPAQQSNEIPQAPPLPPRSTFQRLAAQLPSLGPGRPSTLNAGRSDVTRSRVAPSLPVISGINALSSQDATHKTGLDICALDVNHDRTQAILAGREILRTISVHGTRCSEVQNLRSAIINYASHNTRGSARHRETLDIHDVKWSHGNYKSSIATAATNGKIVLYDINKPSIELARLHEHHRQVHKLAFNPYQPSSLLSASQDGTVRLWDLRDLSRQREVMMCRSRQAFHGQSEGIRDVRWSPTNGETFAFCTDNGAIQKWETRNAKGPTLRINAHDKLCHAIDWHPDGKHIISGSADRTVKVWDFSSDQRRQKAAWTLRAPYAVSNVRWRPPCRATTQKDLESWQCTQFATTFERYSQILVWDFRRPYVPFREIVKGSMPPSDMLWHSQHLLWTVTGSKANGREAMFAQTDVQYAPKVLERRNMQAVAISPAGEISVFSQKRSRRRGTLYDRTSDASALSGSRDRRNTADPVHPGSLSRSSADDSLDDSFLSSSHRKHHGRTLSNRSTKSFSSTPPSEDVPVKDLEETLRDLKASYKPHQVAFRGSLSNASNPAIFAFLAQKYKHHSHKEFCTVNDFQHAHRLFEQNAEYAQRVSFYRLAQSFRIAGNAMQHQLQQRAELMRRRRLGQAPAKVKRQVFRSPETHQSAATKAVEEAKAPTEYHQPVTSPLRTMLDSTSNVATPLARPHETNGMHGHKTVPSLSDLDTDTYLALPPPIAGPGSVSPDDARRSQAQRPAFNGPHWYNSSGDLNDRRAMLNNYRQPPKAPLNLEPSGITSPPSRPINIPPPLDRHNSDESFAMFSTSTDSRGISVPGSLTSGRSSSKQMDSVPEAWEKLDNDGSSNVWRSDSDKASSEDPASTRIEQQPWPEDGSSIGQTSDGSESPAKTSANVEDKVRFQEPIEMLSPRVRPLPAVMSKAEATPMPRAESMSFSAAFDSSFPGTDSQPSRGAWSTSNTSSSQYGTLDASGTVISDEAVHRDTDFAVQPVTKGSGTKGPDGPTQSNVSQEHILADYEDRNVDDDDDEQPGPFPMSELLSAMLDYHTANASDAQTAAQLLLLLAPLLPRTSPVEESVVARTFIIFSDVMNGLGLTSDAVQRQASRSLERMLDSGLHPLQAEAILSTYHDQLLSLNLLNAAANLRQLCYPTFPAVYEQSIKSTSIGLRCEGCRNPLNNPKGKLRCESCSKRQAPCPICWCETPAIDYPAPKAKKAKRKRSRTRASSLATSTGPSFNADAGPAPTPSDPERSNAHVDVHPAFNDPADVSAVPASPRHVDPVTQTAVLWLTCPMCNHSAHLSCFSAWLTTIFEPGDLAEGACPSPGCTCDCAPGALRDERVKKIEQRVAQRDRERGREGRAIRDEWKASESRAVSQVRGMVESTASLPSREGRGDRRVRLLEPEEYAALAAPKPRRNWVMGN